MKFLFRTRGVAGFALAYFLIISALIIMLTGSTLVLGREGLRTTRGGVDASRALYAAEAGMNLIIAELERDSNWTGSADDVAMPGGAASYSFEFVAIGATAGMDQSINNLSQDTSAPSYRGTDTVPPHSALLVVTGRSGLATRTVEALVVSGMNVREGEALIATGKVDMVGDVKIDGRKSLVNMETVPADFHTNIDFGEVQVRYRSADSGQQLEVTGNLTCSSPLPESDVFNINPPIDLTKLRSNKPAKWIPRPNIQAMVDDGIGSLSTPIPTTPGELRMSGQNYYDDDVTVQGDLVLEDGTVLLVDGNLTVNGSISGRGQVVVNGNTSFFGEARVAFYQDDYVSLLSKGHVVLRGFKGQEYMKALALSNPTLTRDTAYYAAYLDDPPAPINDLVNQFYPSSTTAEVAWQNLQTALGEIHGVVAVAAEAYPDPSELRVNLYEQDIRLDTLMAVVSSHRAGADNWSTGLEPSVSALFPPDGVTYNNAGMLAGYMEGQGGGPLSASRFLGERFRYLEDLFRIGDYRRDGAQVSGPMTADGGLPSLPVFLNYEDWDPRLDGGLFDAMQSQPNKPLEEFGVEPIETLTPPQEQAVLDIVQSVLQYDIDRLGSAHFKGVVYTSGAFVATGDVVVRGSVLVNGDPTVGPLELEDVSFESGEKSFLPGDVGLYGYTSLSYVEELFDDGIHNLAGNGVLDIKRWTSR